ncbi:hypothetical protein BH23CHL2_BH23CHL2_03760 [soil metagenome]
MSFGQRTYLDSSVFIGAAIPGSNHNALTQAFCRQLVAEDTIVVYSVIMRYEYAHIANELANSATRRHLPRETINAYDLSDWDTDSEVRRRWMATVSENLDRLLDQFAYYVEVPINSEIWPLSIDAMVQHQLRSYDTLHVATARYFGITKTATCDRHFAEVDDLEVAIIRDT